MASADIIVPSAPAFLDPLVDIETCYYYAVPAFFSFHHANTKWLIAMIKTNEVDRVRRKMELNPELFKGKYFQLMDNPRLYLPEDPSVTPMFKRQSVLYLSALGISIYLRSLNLVDLILFQKNPYDEVIGDPNEPQFASHLQDMKYGDFHSFPPSVIMLRMYCFDCTTSLLQAGWNPTLPLALPMRRKFERRSFYFYDWLEAALCLLGERPLYPLQSLVLNVTRNMAVYKFLKLPITRLLPQTLKQRVPTGLIDVEDLPVGTRMIGVRSLLEVAEDYDRYQQMRSCAVEVAALKREATAIGLNPEILMMQALDYDGYVADQEVAAENENNALRGRASVPARLWGIQHDTLPAVNANNSATDAAAAAGGSGLNVNMSAKKKGGKNFNYASEGCRVMFFAMEKDKTGKRMQVCLDTIVVLCKRGFYVNGESLPPESLRSRDTRNIMVLILNMIQREQDKLDIIFAKIQSGYKRFPHLEEHKMLENRRLASVANIDKMISVLTKVLMYSKELVSFIRSNFPPFHVSTVDMKINHRLQTRFNEIKVGVVRAFNSIKDGWTHLTKEMMQEVAHIKSIEMHFRVGIKPTAAQMLAAKKAARKFALKGKSKNNMSNTNSCFVTFSKVQQRTRTRCQVGIDGARVGAATGGGVDDAMARSVAVPPDREHRHRDSMSVPAIDNPAAAEEADEKWMEKKEEEEEDEPLLEEDVPLLEEDVPLLEEDVPLLEEDEALMDASLMEDITGDYHSITETGLLLSSLCKEVQDMLRPRLAVAASTNATAVTGSKSSYSDGYDDVATIEPEPGISERGGAAFDMAFSSWSLTNPFSCR